MLMLCCCGDAMLCVDMTSHIVSLGKCLKKSAKREKWEEEGRHA